MSPGALTGEWQLSHEPSGCLPFRFALSKHFQNFGQPGTSQWLTAILPLNVSANRVYLCLSRLYSSIADKIFL
jgi:hypothetical protein